LHPRTPLSFHLVPTVYFTSALRRAQHTLDLILDELGITEVTLTRSKALNKRDYGDLAGLNKDDARAKWAG
jgi:2,3-bisphosphoglycerate-dependent phosphoglycerate mutase